MEICKVCIHNEPHTIWEIADVYWRTFGHSPWFEGYICPVCKSTFELNEVDPMVICPKCAESEKLVLLVEYWPKSKIITDFYNENTKDDAVCLIAKDRGSVVGFAWGYPLKITKETSQKLEAPGLEKRITISDVFYLDECAVLPEYQKHGIGKLLVETILNSQPLDKMFLRTLVHSPMHKLIIKLSGRDIMYIPIGRVIMEVIKLSRIQDYVDFPHY